MAVLDAFHLERCGITADSHVLAAVSGGADSTALLLLLAECLDGGLIGKLSAAHFNHCLRGKDSDADEQFCRELCERLAIPFFSGSGDVLSFAKEQGNGIENAARMMRYAYLQQVMSETGSDCIATAHHAEDQAETVLQHFLRGTGPKGLCGMSPRSGEIARPLLYWSREDILKYLADQNQTYCLDETNLDMRYSRNRIRLELLPALEKLQPKLTEHLCDLSEDMRADEAFFLPFVARAMEDSETDGGFDRTLLKNCPEAVRRRVLVRLLNKTFSYDICRNDVKKLEWLLSAPSGKRVMLRNGLKAWNDGPIMRIGKKAYNQDPGVDLYPGTTVVTDGWRIRTEYADRFEKPSSEMEAFIAVDPNCGLTLTARRKQNGDRFHPLGMRGSRLLSDIFTDRKYPEKLRTVPLIRLGDEIVFVPGYTIAENVRVTPESETIIHILVEEVAES
ncbi:MAG: tRNA lysidine(34) synthetase TilS [Clostridia bacterium]|nr:tRNA lysidine(34) synthetase TilS [Clostridia bacterium]